jgi:hypothetical protein
MLFKFFLSEKEEVNKTDFYICLRPFHIFIENKEYLIPELYSRYSYIYHINGDFICMTESNKIRERFIKKEDFRNIKIKKLLALSR